MRNTCKRDIPAHLSHASTEGIPTRAAIASSSTAATYLGVCSTEPTSATRAGDCLVGIDTRTASDLEVPAREVNSTTRSVPTSAACAARSTPRTRVGVVHASTASTASTTLRDVVGKRAA
jgi:hypothetical protein